MEERGENTTLLAGAAERQFQNGKKEVHHPVFFVRVGKAFGMRELQVYEKWERGSD